MANLLEGFVHLLSGLLGNLDELSGAVGTAHLLKVGLKLAHICGCMVFMVFTVSHYHFQSPKKYDSW